MEQVCTPLPLVFPGVGVQSSSFNTSWSRCVLLFLQYFLEQVCTPLPLVLPGVSVYSSSFHTSQSRCVLLLLQQFLEQLYSSSFCTSCSACVLYFLQFFLEQVCIPLPLVLHGVGVYSSPGSTKIRGVLIEVGVYSYFFSTSWSRCVLLFLQYFLQWVCTPLPILLPGVGVHTVLHLIKYFLEQVCTLYST